MYRSPQITPELLLLEQPSPLTRRDAVTAERSLFDRLLQLTGLRRARPAV